MITSPGRARWDWMCFGMAGLVFLLLCLMGGLMGRAGLAPLQLGDHTFSSGRFMVLYMASWASFLFLFLCYPQGDQGKHHVWVILSLSALAHAFWLGFAASDDVNRYLWEGHLLANGISPYHHPPTDPALAALSKGFAHFKGINHPEIPSAYPPFLLYLFSLLGLIRMDPMTVKMTMAALDVMAVFLLIQYLKCRNIDLRWALLYALNPLVLACFAGEGHADVLQTVFLLGALVLYEKKRPALMFVCLGLAVQSKLVSTLVLPFFITRENRRFFSLAVLTVCLPYLPLSNEGWEGLVKGLVIFGKDFAFNGPFQSVLEALGAGRHLARIVCAVLFALVYLGSVVLFRSGGVRNRENTPVSGSLAVLGALIVFSPTVHAWYVCWVLPLAVIRVKRSWLILSLTMCFYFMAPGMAQLGQPWGLPGWALCLEWLPFGVMLSLECLLFMTRFSGKNEPLTVQSVSVVIPAINEETAIKDCVTRIMANPSVIEVVVVDGGSTDRTREAARSAGARVVSHPYPPDRGGGRGGQIKQGITETRGDVVAVVHADTRVDKDAFRDLIPFLNKNPHVWGGALGTVFDRPCPRMKIIECLNTLRAAFFSMSFGDQIQFFRRWPVVENNLFPDLPLMEDVEFSIRLWTLGQSAYLFGDSRASSRRWEKKGLGNAATVLGYFFAYLAVRPFKKPDTVKMYRKYYGK